MSAAIAVLFAHAQPLAIERAIARLSGQSLPADRFELVVVDRTEGYTLSTIVRQASPGFAVHVLKQGPASRAQGGNLAVFGTSAPLVLFLDPLVDPEPGLLEAHVAAHQRAAETAAVIGAVSLGRARRPDARAIADRPALLSFGWPQPGRPARDTIWGGSISVRREVLIRFHLFNPLHRPRFDDLDPAWRLAERAFEPVFEPAALSRLGEAATADELIARAFALGLQEDVHRQGRRRSLAERLGRPADWFDKRALRAHGAAAIEAAARQAGDGRGGFTAQRRALYAAWRRGRTESIRRRQT